jgi:hypothetical protein
MANYSTITEVPFTINLFEADLVDATNNHFATAKWQPTVDGNLAGVNIVFSDLSVAWTSTTGSATTTLPNMTLTGTDEVVLAAQAFPNLAYSVGVEELTAAVLTGKFTYQRGSASPVNTTTELFIGIRYNADGDNTSGFLTVGDPLHDPSNLKFGTYTFNGTTNVCTVGRASKLIRFGPQKIKFHRAFALATAACRSALDAPQ